MVICQKESVYDVEFDVSDDKFYIYQDDVDGDQECIELDVTGAKQLIKVLQEFVNETQ